MAATKHVAIDRSHPAYLFFLLDQSGSMQFDLAGAGEGKAKFLSDAINRLLNTIILSCTRGRGDGIEVRHYFDISVLGYGNPMVDNALGGALATKRVVGLPELAEHPLRVEQRKIKQNDGCGGVVELDEEVPMRSRFGSSLSLAERPPWPRRSRRPANWLASG